jgi:hypothetical protein
MLKDIEIPITKDVYLAAAKEDENDEQWKVFIVNEGQNLIKSVLINSTGMGKNSDGEKIQTSTLRHFFEAVPAKSAQGIELIDPSVFHLSNEYWISFWINDKMYDRRFLFVPDSISDKNLEFVKLLNKNSVVTR